MGGTLSCAGKGHSPADEDKRPYGAPIKSNGIIAPSEKYIVPTGNAFVLILFDDLQWCLSLSGGMVKCVGMLVDNTGTCNYATSYKAFVSHCS